MKHTHNIGHVWIRIQCLFISDTEFKTHNGSKTNFIASDQTVCIGICCARKYDTNQVVVGNNRK